MTEHCSLDLFLCCKLRLGILPLTPPRQVAEGCVAATPVWSLTALSQGSSFCRPASRHHRSGPYTPGTCCGVLVRCSLSHQGDPPGGPKPALWASLEPVGSHVKGLCTVAVILVPLLVGSLQLAPPSGPRSGHTLARCPGGHAGLLSAPQTPVGPAH